MAEGDVRGFCNKDLSPERDADPDPCLLVRGHVGPCAGASAIGPVRVSGASVQSQTHTDYCQSMERVHDGPCPHGEGCIMPHGHLGTCDSPKRLAVVNAGCSCVDQSGDSTACLVHNDVVEIGGQWMTQAQYDAARFPLTESLGELHSLTGVVAAPKSPDSIRAAWVDIAYSDVAAFAPKAAEYGSRDLTEMGYSMARMAGREVEDDEAYELGVYFYMLGKMGRWQAAVERGERVSDDTLLDMTTYSMMARLRRSGDLQ